MAENGHGGQRTPANPAPVSGPGALSARTDGGPTSPPPMRGDGSYGDSADMESIQGGASTQAPAGPGARDLVPLGAPSQAPTEPVTAGAALGPGVGPQAAGIASDEDATLDQLRPLLRGFETLANLPNATPQTRAFVRALKARMAGR